MGAKILSRRKFATLAGVAPSSITKACSNGLRDACIGRRIDASHPAARQYIEKQQFGRPDPGLDPLYFQVVEWCHANRLYKPTPLRLYFKIGTPRAKALLDLMSASGEIPSPASSADDPPDAMSEVFSAGSLPTPPPAASDRSQRAAIHTTPASVPNTERLTGGAPAPPAHAAVDPSVSAGAAPSDIPDDIQVYADMTLRELIWRFGTDLRFKDWLAATKEIEKIAEVRLKNAKTEGQLVSREKIKTGVFDPLDAAFRQLLTDGVKTLVIRMVAKHDSGGTTKELEEFVGEHIGSYLRPMKAKMARGLRNA